MSRVKRTVLALAVSAVLLVGAGRKAQADHWHHGHYAPPCGPVYYYRPPVHYHVYPHYTPYRGVHFGYRGRHFSFHYGW